MLQAYRDRMLALQHDRRLSLRPGFQERRTGSGRVAGAFAQPDRGDADGSQRGAT